MPDYVVKMTFKGVDDTSKIFAAMERAAAKYGGTARQSMRGVGREADHASTALRNATKHGYNFGSIVKGILAANAIRGGIGMIGSGLRKAAGDYLEFGDTMTGAVARFDEVDTRSAAFGQTIDKMGKQVRKSMAGTRHSAVDGAMALNELAKAGYNSNAALQILPNLTAFATAAQEKLAEATTMSSDILGGFGLRNDNVAVQLKNHVKLNDQLTKSALLATGDMRDMFETMQVVAPLSKEMNMPQETALALAVALSNAGIKGTEAATAIKRSMLNIYASSNRAELELNGVHPFDKMGNPRKITEVYKEMGAALDKLKPSDRIPIMKQYFGIYGLAGVVKIMRELKAISEYEKQIGNSNGLTQRMADAANTSPLAKLMMLGNTALEKAFQVLDQYAGKAGGGFDWLREKIMGFNVKPLIDALNVTGKALWTLYTIARPFIPILPYLIGGFVMWKAAVGALSFAKFIIQMGSMVKLGFQLFSILSGFGSVWAGLGVPAAILTGIQALAAAMVPIATAALALVAVGSMGSAVYSLFTGKDNPISMLAQRIGLVPELEHDAEGNITGRKGKWFPDSPNEKEAQAASMRDSVRFYGQLNITGAPAGSTFNGNTYGAPPMLVNMGANPK